MKKYLEINEKGNNIRCKLYFDKVPDIKKVVVACTGFAGHKDNKATEKLAERITSKFKGVAVLTFNWPCHGDDVKKKLTFSDSLDYLEMVLDFVNNSFKPEAVYGYGTSFGAYMILNYIKLRNNPFNKIVLRNPAVNMYESLSTKLLTPENRALVEKGKPALAGFDRKIEITQEFLQDLQKNDVRGYEYLEESEQIIAIHGKKDEIIPYEIVDKFCDDNLILLYTAENGDHRFQDPKDMEFAIKTTIEFFGF